MFLSVTSCSHTVVLGCIVLAHHRQTDDSIMPIADHPACNRLVPSAGLFHRKAQAHSDYYF